MTTRPRWSTEDEDLTLTVPLRAYLPGDLDVTDVIVHPSFRVEAITETLPVPSTAYPSPTQRAASAESFPSRSPEPFWPAPSLPRPHSEVSRRFPRVSLDSESTVSTWKRTVPALRRLLGLPVVPGWRPTPLPRPIPVLAMAPEPPPSRLSPLVPISMAVCLVAMVLFAIVGLGSRAAEASRQAHTRVVSASAPDGSAVTDGVVFVDGSAECQGTPCELELTPGVHWVTVRAPGFETPPSRSINAGENEPPDVIFQLVGSAVRRAPWVAAAPAPVHAQPLALVAAPAPAMVTPDATAPVAPEAPRAALVRPAPLGARLNVNSIPVSNVLVDGRPVGQTPVLGLKVKPGAHSVVFISPDGKRVVRSTVVGAGRTATVAARL